MRRTFLLARQSCGCHGNQVKRSSCFSMFRKSKGPRSPGLCPCSAVKRRGHPERRGPSCIYIAHDIERGLLTILLHQPSRKYPTGDHGWWSGRSTYRDLLADMEECRRFDAFGVLRYHDTLLAQRDFAIADF